MNYIEEIKNNLQKLVKSLKQFMKAKICGISDSNTLIYITNHPYPPEYIGFIVNYKKSKRFINSEKLIELLKIEKKSTSYVAVLVKPTKDDLEKIKDL